MSNLRLNALFDNIATNSLSRAQLHESGDVQNLHYGDIHLKYSGILNLNDSSLPFALKSDYKFKPGAELQTGDVVFADAAEDYEGIGKAVEIGIQGEIAAYAGLHTIHLRKKTDLLHNGYIGYLTQSPRFRRQIWFIAQGAKVLGISSKEVLKLEIEIPELSYQSRVVNALKSVDHKINLLTKKKQALETYKKGLMQKIFTQELRFNREDGTNYADWCFDTIEGLSKVCKSGGTPTASNKAYYGGEIPFLAISDMTSQGKYILRTANSITESGLVNSSAWVLPKDTIIFSMYASVGFVSINKIPLATSQAVLNIIVDHSKVEVEYLYYWLSNFQSKLHTYITTGTQGNLNARTVNYFNVLLPELAEQKRIVQLLSLADLRIDKINATLNATLKMKSSFLQQMFV